MDSPPPQLVGALSEFEPRERLISLYACQDVWPSLREDPDWRSRIDQTRRVLNPSARELEAIFGHAGRVARALRDEIPPDPPLQEKSSRPTR
jgi:hypothetical protein